LCRRYRALVRGHLEGPRARIRAARRSAGWPCAHDRLAGDSSRYRGGHLVTPAPRGEVVYVLPNKLGGVFSYVHQLLAHRRPDGFSYAAVRTQNARDRDHNIFEPLPADGDGRFEYSLPPENVHAVLRRLALTIPFGPGVIV